MQYNNFFSVLFAMAFTWARNNGISVRIAQASGDSDDSKWMRATSLFYPVVTRPNKRRVFSDVNWMRYIMRSAAAATTSAAYHGRRRKSAKNVATWIIIILHVGLQRERYVCELWAGCLYTALCFFTHISRSVVVVVVAVAGAASRGGRGNAMQP